MERGEVAGGDRDRVCWAQRKGSPALPPRRASLGDPAVLISTFGKKPPRVYFGRGSYRIGIVRSGLEYGFSVINRPIGGKCIRNWKQFITPAAFHCGVVTEHAQGLKLICPSSREEFHELLVH